MLLSPIILNFVKAGSDKEISFDRIRFQDIKGRAGETQKAINSKREEVKRAIEELREKWQTPAGRDFFEKLDDNWDADIDKFNKTMDAFIQVMDEVDQQFQEIERQVSILHSLADYDW